MKEFRIEDPRCRCSGQARQIESPTFADWLAFRAPLVTLVTCRRQVSSIYRARKQQIEVTTEVIHVTLKVIISHTVTLKRSESRSPFEDYQSQT